MVWTINSQLSLKIHCIIREVIKIRRGLWEAKSKPMGAGFLMFGGRNRVNSSRNAIHNGSDFVPEK